MKRKPTLFPTIWNAARKMCSKMTKSSNWRLSATFGAFMSVLCFKMNISIVKSCLELKCFRFSSTEAISPSWHCRTFPTLAATSARLLCTFLATSSWSLYATKVFRIVLCLKKVEFEENRMLTWQQLAFNF